MKKDKGREERGNKLYLPLPLKDGKQERWNKRGRKSRKMLKERIKEEEEGEISYISLSPWKDAKRE